MMAIAAEPNEGYKGVSEDGVSAASEPLLCLRGVAQVFGTGPKSYHALDNISLDVFRGEFLCLLGPSGCGKSTLLNIIAGFIQATSGSVRFAGETVTRPEPSRMMVFQDSSLALLPWLSAADNVGFGLKLRGVPKPERVAAVKNYLGAVGLTSYGDRFPHEMSGGMRQRLQIARALATRPDVLLMDEPFAAVDAITRRHMHRVLLDIWQQSGVAVIFVTHDISESLMLADRIAVMSIGPRSSVRDLLDLKHLVRPRDATTVEYVTAYRNIENLLDADPNMSDLL